MGEEEREERDTDMEMKRMGMVGYYRGVIMIYALS